MVMTCHVSLDLKGEEQILMIPREFAMSGTEVLLRKEGDRLIVDLIPTKSLLTTLQSLQEISDPFPDFETRWITESKEEPMIYGVVNLYREAKLPPRK